MPHTPAPIIELSVKPGDRRLDAEWEIKGASELKHMSIQWRERSSEDWDRYVSPRKTFLIPDEKDAREYAIDFIPKYDEDKKDWVSVELTNGMEYQVRVWVEFKDGAYGISNVVVVSPNRPTPTATATNTPTPTATATATPTPTFTATPTPTPTFTPHEHANANGHADLHGYTNFNSHGDTDIYGYTYCHANTFVHANGHSRAADATSTHFQHSRSR